MGSSYSSPAADPAAATPFSDTDDLSSPSPVTDTTPVTIVALTPGAGTYLVLFGGSWIMDTIGEGMNALIFGAGVEITQSSRLFLDAGGEGAAPKTFQCAARITVTAGQEISGRVAVLSGGGEICTIVNANLQVVRVS